MINMLPGQIWDTTDGAMVMLAHVRETHVSVWPLTSDDFGPASFPAFQIKHNSETFAVWPQAQFSVERDALTVPSGFGVDPDTLRNVAVAVAARTPMPVVTFGPLKTVEQWDALDAVCLAGWRLADTVKGISR